jgi:hypothetical protein
VITGCITQPSTPIVHSALLVKNITQRAQSKISEHTVIFKIFILIFHAIHVKNFTQRAQRFLRLTLPFSTGAVQLLFPSFVFPLVANNGKGRIYRYRLGGLQSAPTGIPPSPGICGECASSNSLRAPCILCVLCVIVFCFCISPWYPCLLVEIAAQSPSINAGCFYPAFDARALHNVFAFLKQKRARYFTRSLSQRRRRDSNP